METPRDDMHGAERLKPVLEASAVVAHRVSRDTAKREVSRIAFRVTLREVLIFVVLLASLVGAVLYFEKQHTSDQQKLKDRRDLINTRINDLQGDINDLRKLIQELRAALLKAGVNPKQVPAAPSPSPSASQSNSGSIPSASAGTSGAVAIRSSAQPSPSAGSSAGPSSTPSSIPHVSPSALVSLGPIEVPVLGTTLPPIRIPVP